MCNTELRLHYFTLPLKFNSTLKIDKKSWPDFNAIWQADANYGDMIVFVVLELLAVAAATQYYFRHISIHGWDITSSGLEKLTFRPYHHNRHVILHQPVNRATCCRVMTSYRFQDGSRDSTLQFRFRIGWREKVKIYRQTKFRPYNYPRLRYNYFQFGKTNVRYIAIPLPVLTLTNIFIIGMLFCISLPNFIEISLPAAE